MNDDIFFNLGKDIRLKKNAQALDSVAKMLDLLYIKIPAAGIGLAAAGGIGSGYLLHTLHQRAKRRKEKELLLDRELNFYKDKNEQYQR